MGNQMILKQIRSLRDRASQLGKLDLVRRFDHVVGYLLREHDDEPEDPRDIASEFTTNELEDGG